MDPLRLVDLDLVQDDAFCFFYTLKIAVSKVWGLAHCIVRFEHQWCCSVDYGKPYI